MGDRNYFYNSNWTYYFACVPCVTIPIMLVKLAVVWTVAQVVEENIISPQIMGKLPHIHPITIILILLTHGSLFHIAGVILAIAGYALLKIVATHVFQLFKVRYNKYKVDVRMYHERPTFKNE